MSGRAWTNADAPAIVAILNDNAPYVNAYIPMAAGITAQQFRNRIMSLANMRGYVSLNADGVTIDGVLAVQLDKTPPSGRAEATVDYVFGMFIRIGDRLPMQTGDPVLNDRLKAVLRDVLQLGSNAIRARGRTVWAEYPLAGHPAMIAALGRMTSANGIQPDTQTRPGWLTYIVGPNDLDTAIGAI